MKAADRLRRQKFVEHYAATGNAAESARLAGYSEKGARQQGKTLLTNPDIQSALAKLVGGGSEGRIASAKERQEWWTSIMRSSGSDMKSRLKASELLSKVQGDFVERVELSGTVGVQVNVYLPDNGRG